MPKPKHKKNAFIDKKASTSFHLVHRSQKVSVNPIILSAFDGCPVCGK